MSLGLKRGNVRIVEYDPDWVNKYENEKANLIEIFSDHIIKIEHVGSTAVPGLASKPIIDILIGVKSFTELTYFIEKMPEIGYEYMPERMFENRKFFPKGPQEKRTHHVSIVIAEDPREWYDKLLFRDYLRSNKNTQNNYAILKKQLAAKYANDREKYTLAKDSFIEQTIIEAKSKKLNNF